MAKNYGFTKEEALAELKRRGVDTSKYENSVAAGPAEAPATPLTPGSEGRARIELGIGPVTNAQRNMFSAEGGADRTRRRNPFNEHPVRSFLSSLDNGKAAEWAGFSLDPIARGTPGKGQQDFQDYDQAAKSFEAAILPIMSGAAVTPSEAQRQIRSNLPAWGDTPLTLERKATNRAMMANAAAELVGKPRPFPKVGVWDSAGDKAGSQPRPGQPDARAGSAPAAKRAPVKVQTVEQAKALPPGTVFITPDGRTKVR